jgi:hypothetical protein
MDGSELEFVSWIHRDGSDVTPMEGKDVSALAKESFRVRCLSISQRTYIASGFNSYVVRMKAQNS